MQNVVRLIAKVTLSSGRVPDGLGLFRVWFGFGSDLVRICFGLVSCDCCQKMNMWKLPRSFRVAGVAFGAHGVALGSLSALAGLCQVILEKSWILTLCDRRGIWCMLMFCQV